MARTACLSSSFLPFLLCLVVLSCTSCLPHKFDIARRSPRGRREGGAGYRPGPDPGRESPSPLPLSSALPNCSEHTARTVARGCGTLYYYYFRPRTVQQVGQAQLSGPLPPRRSPTLARDSEPFLGLATAWEKSDVSIAADVEEGKQAPRHCQRATSVVRVWAALFISTFIFRALPVLYFLPTKELPTYQPLSYRSFQNPSSSICRTHLLLPGACQHGLNSVPSHPAPYGATPSYWPQVSAPFLHDPGRHRVVTPAEREDRPGPGPPVTVRGTQSLLGWPTWVQAAASRRMGLAAPVSSA